MVRLDFLGAARGALCAAAIMASALLAMPAEAVAKDEIVIGLTGDITSVDPHFHSLAANNGLAMSIFDGLARPDAMNKPVPGIAESWKLIDDTTWEFKIRDDAKFHDGSPVTAEDVIFTFQRALEVKDSPSGGFARSLRGKTPIAVSDKVLRIKTDGPHPTLLTDLMIVAIISKKNAEGATRQDFNSGKAAIGSGPYKFVSWTPGQSVVLERNDDYWGEKPDFAKVTLKPITSDPTRVAALLAGDVDVIEQVPSGDVARLQADPEITISKADAKRIMYIGMDQFRDQALDITDNDGKPIKNPLLDVRVRRALSTAINRELLVEAVMDGAGTPARQYAPDGSEGNSKTLPPLEYSVEKAKSLLAEAGYPDGFRTKLHGANDRYPKAKEIAEAVGQMFTRVGVKTEVITMPGTIFFRRGTSGGPGGTPEFSMNLQGCCASPGEAIAPLLSLMHTYQPDKGLGTANRGMYSNPELDALLAQGRREMDDAKRDAVIGKATEVAVNDMAVIPLFFNVNTWATRGDVRWKARTDDITVASDAYLEK